MINWIADQAPMIGLLFFFLFFCGVAIWLYRPGMKQKIEPLGMLPLNAGNPGIGNMEGTHDE